MIYIYIYVLDLVRKQHYWGKVYIINTIQTPINKKKGK